MVLPTNNARPQLPYTPLQSLANADRYENLDKKAPLAEMVDSDCNWLTDQINILCGAINNIQAGVIVGADNPLSKFKFPTTDGAGNISWTFVQNQNIADLAITASKLDAEAAPIGCIPMVTQARTVQYLPFVAKTSQIGDGAITTPKLGDGAVTTPKLGDGAITTPKLGDGAVVNSKIADSAITTPKIADSAITTSKIANSAITVIKMNSGTSVAGTVLTAQGGGAATYQAISKILQIKQYLANTIVSTPDSLGNYISFTTPFTLSITPLSTTSIIQINISMNMSAFSSQAGRVIFAAALYRNDLLWPKATAVTSEVNTTAALFGGSTINEYIPLQNFSAALYDDTAHTLAPIKYEIKACCLEVSGKVLLNTCFNKGANVYEGAVGVSSIVLTEIQL